MAQRGEGQGLQIAVISFAILAILLAGMAYFFFSSAQAAKKDLDVKNKSLADAQQQINKLMYQVTAMNYVLGRKGVAQPDLEVAKGKVGEDPEVKEILEGFAADVSLVGDQVAPDGAKSYHTFTTALIAALNKKNASAADAIDQSKNAQNQKDAVAKAETERANTAVAAATKAAEDIPAERASGKLNGAMQANTP